MEYGRILAGDVQPGDVVGRVRGIEAEVAEVKLGSVAVRLVFTDGSTIRPRKTAVLWKVVA